MKCKCGCGEDTVNGNIYIHGHNRRGLISNSKGGLWSVLGHTKCKVCGTKDRPHYSKGVCLRCYKTAVYKENDKWQGRVCVRCGKNDKPYKAKGLCNSCYSVVRDRSLGKKKRNFGAWSWYYDKCKQCGTTERDHAKEGLCYDCYDSSKRIGNLIKCPVCGTQVEKLSQHLAMRSRKCDEHKEYLHNLYKKYFDSDLNLSDIGDELGTDRHTVSRNFSKLFGKAETKERNEKVRRCNISEKAIINMNYKNMFGTPTEYASKNNGIVTFRSKLEHKFAKELDKKDIAWQYEPTSFPYIDIEGVRRTYTPDFYLLTEDKYIEIKSSDLIKDKDWYKVNWVKDNTPIAIEVILMK